MKTDTSSDTMDNPWPWVYGPMVEAMLSDANQLTEGQIIRLELEDTYAPEGGSLAS